MLTTDIINPSVKIFIFLIDSIDHQSQNPFQTRDHQCIGLHSTNGINPPVKNRFPSPPFF
jgi:hypothetical protein